MKPIQEHQKEKQIDYLTKLISDMKIQLYVSHAEQEDTELPAPAVMPIYDVDVMILGEVLKTLKGEEDNE